MTFSLNTQSANLVFAGPTTGSAAQPGFRSLVAADIPTGFFQNPMTTLGDIIYGGASGAPTRLAGNTTSTREFYISTGSGAAATAPTIGVLVSGDIPNNAANTSGTAANITATSNSTITTLSGLTTAGSLATVGTIGTGVWQGTAVAAGYGGTGISTAASTGVPSISAGTWSVNSVLPATLGGTGQGSNFTQYGTFIAATTAAMGQVGPGTSTYYLTSNGSSGPPSYQQVTLNNSSVAGVLPIANGGTDNGSLSVAAGSVLYTDGTKVQSLPIGTANQVLQVNAGATAPVWGSGTSLVYGSAFFGASAEWSTTSSGAFADPTFSGTAGFSTAGRANSGITLTAAASNLPGITFTPASASAVYFISARFQLTGSSSSGAIAQLTDGTIVVDASGNAAGTSAVNTFGNPCTLQGVYAPATTSPVTVKIQLGSENAGSAFISPGSTYGTAGSSIEWTVFQLPLNIISSVSSSLIGGMVTYGVYS